jgi:hypothetical protein
MTKYDLFKILITVVCIFTAIIAHYVGADKIAITSIIVAGVAIVFESCRVLVQHKNTIGD